MAGDGAKRCVDLGAGVGVQTVVLDIRHHTDDLTPFVRNVDTPAEGFRGTCPRVSAVTANHGLIDEDSIPRGVAACEKASPPQRHAHGTKIIKADGPEV